MRLRCIFHQQTCTQGKAIIATMQCQRCLQGLLAQSKLACMRRSDAPAPVPLHSHKAPLVLLAMRRSLCCATMLPCVPAF